MSLYSYKCPDCGVSQDFELCVKEHYVSIPDDKCQDCGRVFTDEEMEQIYFKAEDDYVHASNFDEAEARHLRELEDAHNKQDQKDFT